MPTMMDCPQVPLEFMNRDHARFVSQLDSLLGLLYSHATLTAMDEALEALLLHTREHFAEEERQMVQYRFPPLVAHQVEHERTLAAMVSRIVIWKVGRDRECLEQWLKVELPAWLVDHIDKMDFVSAWFIADLQ